jgi:NADPH:quinone reductase-like Zn-dependent oxidoreductase
MMRAVLQDQCGDEKTLYVGETSIPVPLDGEVLIRVCCTALNRMDLLQCRGTVTVRRPELEI